MDELPLPCVFRAESGDCKAPKDFEIDRPLPAVCVIHLVVHRCNVDIAAECYVRRES